MESPNYLKKLGSNIFLLRKNANLSQAEVAYRANIDVNYMGEIERGESNPSIKVLRKICRSLKISLSTLTEGV